MFSISHGTANIRLPKGPVRLIGGFLAIIIGSGVTVLSSMSLNLINWTSAIVLAAGVVVLLLGIGLINSMRASGALALFAAILLFVNDTDRFAWGDLVDSYQNGVLHHEPFTLFFLLLGAGLLVLSFRRV
jgi:hypothetical protein